jgi:hypothetical protein
MTAFMRMTFAGLAVVALSSTLSIATSTVEPARAAEPASLLRVLDTPPESEAPAPPSSEDDRTRTLEPSQAPDEDTDEDTVTASSCAEASSGRLECIRRWWPGGTQDPGESTTDIGSLEYVEGRAWTIYAACDFNGDGISIGIQIDATDGTSNYYTRRPIQSCQGERESRTIHRFRFVAVDRSGTPVGTPTAWETPPRGSGPA